MTKFADSVKQAAILTSTATITPGAAPTGYRTLAQAIADTAGKPEQVAVGDTVCMRVDDVADPTKFEIAEYTISGTAQAPTLTRTAIRTSSAGGTTPVTFGGPVTVLCTAQAAYLASLPIVRDIPFSQAVPLSVLGASYMPQQTVSSALTFTPAAGAVRGALSYLRLVADGTNTPDFSAFKESVSSGGYDNRAGIVNAAQFFYDGYDYWFSVFEAVGAAPTATALTLGLSSASTVVGSPVTVTVGVNNPLTGTQTENVTLTAPVAGTWSANPVTLSASTQTVAPTFTASAAGSGNIAASASGTPVLSNASAAYTATAATSYPRLGNLASMTESGSGPYDYTSTGDTFNLAIGGVATKVRQAGVAGSAVFRIKTISPAGTGTAAEVLIGLTSSATPLRFDSIPVWIYAYAQSNPSQYKPYLFGSSQSAANNVACAATDMVRMSWDVGTTVTFDVSKDGGSTWTTVYVATGVSASYTHIQASCSSGSGVNAAITAVSQSGVA